MWSLNVLSFVNYSRFLSNQTDRNGQSRNNYLQTFAGPHQDYLLEELGKDFIIDTINPTELGKTESQVCLFYFSSHSELEDAKLRNIFDTAKESEMPRYCVALLDFNEAEFDQETPITGPDFHEFVIFDGNYTTLRKRLCNLFYSLEDRETHQSQAQQAVCEKLNFVGRSSAYHKLVGEIERYSQCDASLLIRGETGTGKEVAARALHGFSGLDETQFLVIDCASISDEEFTKILRHSLVESGAKQTNHTSTTSIFLDEVDALSLDAQKTLMQFLNRRDYAMETVIGEHQAHARFISATTKDLVTKAKNGKFREDLLYRLSTLSLEVPPLRQRSSDIELIAQKLILKFSEKYQLGVKSIDTESLAWLHQQPWSGNIRELENVLLNAYLMSDTSIIYFQANADETSNALQQISCNSFYDDDISDLSYQQAKEHVLRQFSSTYLASQLAKTEGNVSRAAKLAGKERRAFGKLLKKYNVDKSEYFADAC